MAGFRAVSHMLRFGSGSGLWNASGCAFYMHGRGTDFRFLQRAANRTASCITQEVASRKPEIQTAVSLVSMRADQSPA